MEENSIVFLVSGRRISSAQAAARGAAAADLPEALRRGRLKAAVRVGAAREAGEPIRLEAVPGEDTVVLHIANGPQLFLRPETARDLMLAQSERLRGTVRGADETAPREVTIPAMVSWAGLEKGVATRGATRGFLGGALISLVEVITGAAPDLAAKAIVAKVDDQVAEGIYALRPDGLPVLKESGTPAAPIPAAPDGGPILVFIHGTFSNTSGTFSRLWSQHPQRVRAIFDRYEERVYALEHHTLGKSPIANALMLARSLPADARLHLVTHSRGGLVAEVLARACGDPDFSAAELEAFTAEDRADLKKLVELGRRIRLERVVRVACPARGTLLASKRLDAYLSVLKWTMELGGVPVAPALLDFIAAVAQRREDPDLIPGLAAMIPNSPLVQWLHAVDEAVAGELRVVAGDLEGDSVVSWLKTLLADSFYWTDNDLVVQTSSMYGGAPRAQGATYLLDQGGGVSHFNYFGNDRTAEAIANAVTMDEPPNFGTIGPLSWKGESSSGVRGAGDSDPAAVSRPAVFVLPGILGSNLKVGDKRVWLHLRIVGGLGRLRYDPPRDNVAPDGPVENVYRDLCKFLDRTHHVIEFGYDWRKPLEAEARRLATEVAQALDVRAASGQPVRILAHSMGGLLARTMQLEAPGVWERMMRVEGARMLMLGTPNGGSWAPMQVLSGDDAFGNGLVAVGAPFRDDEARAMMAAFPGFIQLQAALQDANLGLDRAATWKKLADDDLETVRRNNWWHNLGIQLNEYTWGVPPQPVLDQAVNLRQRLDAQSAGQLAAFSDRMLLVVGKASFTPDGYEISPDGLGYRNAQDAGDGRVTLASARLPGVSTWKLDCEHGNLPKKSAAFEAYEELLENGTTQLLDRLTDVRGAPSPGDPLPDPVAHVRSRPSRIPSSTRPPQTPVEMLSSPATASTIDRAVRPEASIGITVVNGDLTFVHRPLLLGHYRSEKLSGTEWVMDRLIGGAMAASLKLGVYPDAPGDYKVFVNTRLDPENPRHTARPEAVVVVGLGGEAKLRPGEIMETVKRGAIAWAQRLAERNADAPADFDLAATLIGSGGSGVSAGQSAQQIADGVRQANERLAELKLPLVRHLEFVEIYLDRASEALRALQVQAVAHPARYRVAAEISEGLGGLRRPIDPGYRGADYDFITAATHKDELGETSIVYTLDTKRARTEVRAQATQSRLLESLVTQASNHQSTDIQIGRTLFKLLIPVEMEPFMSGTTTMVMQLDRGTAGIPWELLDADTPGREERPWAIRASLLRKLQTADYRSEVVDAGRDASVLVIGEPKCDPEVYPRLPGARAEANAIVALLTAEGTMSADFVTALISPDDDRQSGPDERAIMNALLGRSWRIVHISGHGEMSERIGPAPKKRGDPPQKEGDPRGVVLANGTFLGPREIRAMRVVPELVFVNCCHLGAQGPGQLLSTSQTGLGAAYDRPRFAANAAEELIRIGVKCVVAAGWAVDDEAAKSFATIFYQVLLRGRPFIEAVSLAREAARAHGGNTWAAYQCYGDPDWQLRRADELPRDDADSRKRLAATGSAHMKAMTELFAGVTSWRVLEIALETLAIESEFQGKSPEEQRPKIRYLESRFGSTWGRKGAVAEAFAIAWNATGETRNAIEWYEAAIAANDGRASLRAAEQLASLRARLAQEDVARAKETAGAEDLAAAVAEAKTRLAGAIDTLQRLVSLQPTVERESLLASAFKRQAMVLAAAGEPDLKAIASMQRHYRRAEELARKTSSAQFFQPAMHRIAADVILNAGKRGWKGPDESEFAAVRENLARKARDDPDFRSVAGLIELRIYEALSTRGVAAALDSIRAELEDLHARVESRSKWASLRDRARFVLPRYATRASPGEKKAIAALMDVLERFARTPTP